jgi:hypothetical protein
MNPLNIGQPIGGIIQIAYIVADDDFTSHLDRGFGRILPMRPRPQRESRISM